VRHARFGAPRRVLAAALERLTAEGVRVIDAAPTIESDPIGPSIRRYANSAAVIETPLEPPELLALLKRIERKLGRRPGGQRWRARVLDLDIILWSGGAYVSAPLSSYRDKPDSVRVERRAKLAVETPGASVSRLRSTRTGRKGFGPGRPALTIPHPLFRTRAFVLDPAVTIAADWRDPIGGATVRQLHARLTRQRTLPKRAAGQ
jgi:2-amino-4-hydroxy-6-hydroxymethyldihydropteridine diphosphokinase